MIFHEDCLSNILEFTEFYLVKLYKTTVKLIGACKGNSEGTYASLTP
jgi:hypothetical protein